MSNVISLENFRAAQREEANADISYMDIIDRYMRLRGLRIGPAALLHRIIYCIFIEEQSRLSYTTLCDYLGVGRAALSSYIDELEARELISVRRSRDCKKYNKPNHFEINFNGPLGEPVSKLKLPRKPNEKGSTKIELPPSKVVRKANGYLDIINKDKLVPKGTRRVAPTFDSVEEAIDASTKRVVRRRAEKVAKAIRPTSQLTFAGVKATWTAAMLKHYPTVPPVMLTAKEFAMFKAKVLPLLPTACITEIFDYFVGSWSTLRETKFNWLRAKGKDVALAPSIPELMRYWKVFAQAYADSRMVEANSAARSVRSREEELEDAVASAKRETAKARAEASRLQERLARAERIAYSSAANSEEDTRSLTDRRKEADRRYNGSVELPHWK